MSRGPERQRQHSPQVILELTRLRALDGPVTRVVDAGRHLIRKQFPIDRKKLKGEDANVRETIHQPPAIFSRNRGELRCHTRRRRRRLSQDSFPMDVFDWRIEYLTPRSVTDADHGQLVLEFDVLLDKEWRSSEQLPGRFERRRVEDHGLSLSVVTQSAGLEDERKPDTRGSALKILDLVDWSEGRSGNIQIGKELLLQQPVLRSRQRLYRWKNLDALGDESHRRDGYALEFVRDDIHALEKALQRRVITVIRGYQLANLSDWSASVWIEESELDAELVAGKREHPSELPAAEDSDSHSLAAGSG